MWCPLDSVTTCCFVHFTISPSYFLHGLTVCPWVLTFCPKLLLLSPSGKKTFGKFLKFWWRFEPQTFCFPSKHCTTVLCLLGAPGFFGGDNTRLQHFCYLCFAGLRPTPQPIWLSQPSHHHGWHNGWPKDRHGCALCTWGGQTVCPPMDVSCVLGHNSCWTFQPFISILHGHSIHWTQHHRPNVRGPIIHGHNNNAPHLMYRWPKV